MATILNKIGNVLGLVSKSFLGLPENVQESSTSQDINPSTYSLFHLAGQYDYGGRTNLDTLINESYCSNPVVFGMVNKIINCSELIKIIPYRAGRPVLSKSINIDIQKAIFNYITTGTIVIYNKTESIGFYGNTFEIIDTPLVEETLRNGVFSYRVMTRTGGYIPVKESDLIFIKVFDTTTKFSNLGLSPLQVAKMPNDAITKMFKLDNASLDNAGIDVIISAKDSNVPIIEDRINEFDDTINKRINGVRKYGKVGTSKTPIEVHKLGRNQKEMQLWEGYHIKTRSLAAILSYPSSLLDDPDAKTYANYSEAMEAVYTQCTIPIIRKITNNKELVKRVGYDMFVDTSDVPELQKSEKDKADKSTIHQNAIMQLNQGISNGVIDKKIAINILMQTWGYEQKEASDLLINSSNLQ